MLPGRFKSLSRLLACLVLALVSAQTNAFPETDFSGSMRLVNGNLVENSTFIDIADPVIPPFLVALRSRA